MLNNIFPECQTIYFQIVKQYISRMSNNIFPECQTICFQNVEQYISRMSNPSTPGCDSPINEFAQHGGITNGAAW